MFSLGGVEGFYLQLYPNGDSPSAGFDVYLYGPAGHHEFSLSVGSLVLGSLEFYFDGHYGYVKAGCGKLSE